MCNQCKASSRHRSLPRSRRGVAMILLLISCMLLMAFLALAIDIGFMALAQTQVCDIADAAAMAAARTLDGDTADDNHKALAVPNAATVTASNYVLGTQLSTGDVSTIIGCYTYDIDNQRFQGVLGTKPATDNWNLAQATVTADVTGKTIFSKMLNLVAPTTMTATATAAHRPRDIAMILDYSGSMRFSSLPALVYNKSLPGGTGVTSNNHDTIYPKFDAYSGTAGALPPYAMGGIYWLPPYQDCNVTATTSDGRPPIIQDFYTDANGSPAFMAAPASYATTPGGDRSLATTKSGPTYATTVNAINGYNNPTKYWTAFETNGYLETSLYTAAPPAVWNGYTQGPGYFGKTFFIWPPNPVGPNGAVTDWRKLYFNFPFSPGGVPDNTMLFYTTPTADYTGSYTAQVGSLKPPCSQATGYINYTINYDAILKWIKSAPCPFPSQLVSGRIVYYSEIPDHIDTSVYPPVDLNQRFWKDYIDYVLGFSEAWPSSDPLYANLGGIYGAQNYVDIASYTGYGPDYPLGTVKVTPPPAKQSNDPAACYMNYLDNPQRPLLRFWFGPLTMIDFLGNYNAEGSAMHLYTWLPGTCHEYPLYPCKLGIRAALQDIYNNHPNDMVSIIMFSHPIVSGDVPPDPADPSSGNGRFNCARSALSRNYTNMIDSLFYPQSTVLNPGTTVTPYDKNNLEVPRADGCTSYAMALMLAYNQFSSNASLRTYNGDTTGLAGGNGRKGAQKIIIFETDGAPNTPTNDMPLTNQVADNAYYPICYNPAVPLIDNQLPAWIQTNLSIADTTPQIYEICKQLAAQESEFGYSTPSRPLLIHCLAFGPQGVMSDAMGVMQQMQTIGNVTDNMPVYKQINAADSNTIVTKLQQAISTILQDGVQVSLIQ